ncbi:hypothetical protein DPMN_020315 [Dreissena polymorpha]|uniref:Uncharacterized protein n=1 Tax=Dreissena polymorpha TaxID=45954 RepID=A0A9D4NME5_DREPO|nr:hypothetical protein DPMN_020315 [Dreissena polymorpha]
MLPLFQISVLFSRQNLGSWVGIGVGTAVVIGVCVLVYDLWRRRVAARRSATVASLAQGAQAPYPLWQLPTVPSPVVNLPPQYNLYPNVPTVSPNLYPNVPTVSPNLYPNVPTVSPNLYLNVPTVSPAYLPFEPPRPQYPVQNDPKASRKGRRILKGIVTALTWI